MTVRDISNPNAPVAIQTIEGKVVMPLAPSKVNGQLTALQRQLDAANSRGIPNGNAIGLVYLVFQQWRCVREGAHQRDITMQQFLERIYDAIENVFGTAPHSVVTPRTDTSVLDSATTTIGGFQTQVGLGLVLVAR